MKKTCLAAILLCVLSLVSFASTITPDNIQADLNAFIKKNTKTSFEELFPPRTSIQQVEILPDGVKLFFNKEITFYPFRAETPQTIIEMLKPEVHKFIPNANIELYYGQHALSDYVPPIFRGAKQLESKAPASAVPPWVRRISRSYPEPQAGLYGRHICLWGSHGWYYDAQDDLRWEWQRPRMFTNVEDLLPTAFMLPFILPMLENAGAVTCYLRERDTQTEEILLDDGDALSSEKGRVELSPAALWNEDEGNGFKNGLAPYPDDLNPHKAGHHHIARAEKNATAKIRWTPRIPKAGRYAVYVSYNMSDNRAPDARYTVYHLGGKSDFLVNQRMGGNTWLFLDYFQFDEGMNPEKGCVELVNQSEVEGATVSADCVKFGGGMGDIVRGGSVSGYPRYCEASRYWLQYAGVEQTLVYKMGFKGEGEGPDYTEDYVSRAEFANYLKGAPYGPTPNNNHPGLRVPIDLAFAFHTDAGIKDGIVGTLSIYKELDKREQIVFPDGESRLDNNRMLADLIQTQIVDDVRAKYCSTWTRRALNDQDYSETRRGNMPSALLEFLSHQNFQDMKYGIDPRFRFDVSRAIYKAMLRFIAFKNGYEPVVQPLPPTHLVVQAQSQYSALISWKPQPDPLEPTALPEGYIVFMREGADEHKSGFDNGTRVKDAQFVARNLDPDKIYSFRVTAFNAGGESFPSETLCVRTGGDKSGRVLIVNAFDRIAPPSAIIKENWTGFDRVDKGVGYMANYGLAGDQWDFDPKSEFRTNDAPGHGASDGNLEALLELGNTFDFAIRHGAAIAACGKGFDSISEEALREGSLNLGAYPLVDWVLGEERTTLPPAGQAQSGNPDKMTSEFKTLTAKDQEIITSYLDAGGALFITGAYLATDLAEGPESTEQDKKFLTETLKVYWTTNHGSRTNDVFAAHDAFKSILNFHISSGVGEDGIYGVELPDAIKPAIKPKGAKDFQTSETIFRYKDNGWSAAVAMQKPRRIAVFGFPFECICGAENRQAVMKSVLTYLLP
ncbi:MAG TPA: fibronectin type III domain-containing protein [Candidatus Sumerlaeia bacterium]|nr:fibronectin type III domain-containing protein [Candidatus Sumerlaeia bacterium]